MCVCVRERLFNITLSGIFIIHQKINFETRMSKNLDWRSNSFKLCSLRTLSANFSTHIYTKSKHGLVLKFNFSCCDNVMQDIWKFPHWNQEKYNNKNKEKWLFILNIYLIVHENAKLKWLFKIGLRSYCTTSKNGTDK